MNISYTDLVKFVSSYGSKEDSERGPVTEIIGPQIFFTPGLLISRAGMNKRLAMLEAAMFAGGIFDIERIKVVAPKANLSLYEYQSDYGPRTQNQVKNMVCELDSVKSSRKGILLFQPIKSPKSSPISYFKDMACTTSMQFLIRGNKLSTITTMRSCDIVYGFPMDVFMFGMFSQFIASLFKEVTEINCCVQIGSLHMYSETSHLAKEDDSPEFVSLNGFESLCQEFDWEMNEPIVARYFKLRDIFTDIALDNSLNDGTSWRKYKNLCTWPIEFSKFSSDLQMEIS